MNSQLLLILQKTNEELNKIVTIQSLPSPSSLPSSLPSSSLSSSPSSSQELSKFESANGVKLSMTNSPWKTRYNESCYICSYYGHGVASCPNIIESFLGTCIRCFKQGHVISQCKNQKENAPLKSGYKLPTYFC
jgi:hypothetical protein